mgnify:CR=1 FL=1
MSKLKPCPICSQEGIVEDTEGADYIVRCVSCEYFVHDDMNWDIEGYNGRQNAIDKWNDQPHINELQAEIDRLKEENKELGKEFEDSLFESIDLKKINTELVEALEKIRDGNFKWTDIKDYIKQEKLIAKQALAKARGGSMNIYPKIITKTVRFIQSAQKGSMAYRYPEMFHSQKPIFFEREDPEIKPAIGE